MCSESWKLSAKQDKCFRGYVDMVLPSSMERGSALSHHSVEHVEGRNGLKGYLGDAALLSELQFGNGSFTPVQNIWNASDCVLSAESRCAVSDSVSFKLQQRTVTFVPRRFAETHFCKHAQHLFSEQ